MANQKVAENWVSFDLGFLEHFRSLEQREFTATVSYEPHTATCAPMHDPRLMGRWPRWSAFTCKLKTARTTQGAVDRVFGKSWHPVQSK